MSDQGEETTVRRGGGTERVRVFSGTGPPDPLPKATRRPGSKAAATVTAEATVEATKAVNENEEAP